MKEKNVGVIRLSRKRQKHFRSLAPANDIQGVRSYIEWLDEIINDETFGSIAMTGDLGIGKSSVVRTFERTKRYKFIYLSASDLGYRFDENKPDAKAEDAKEKDARQARNAKIQTELEKDLLVQLIALCRRSDIPKSRFRLVPENGAPFLLKAYSFLCGAAALCGGMLAINMLTEQAVYPGTLSMWPWISLAVFASLSVWFWSNRLFQNYRLSKLSFGTDKTYSASAEINPNTLEPESLNTDLHEILYLFERLAKKKHLFKKRRAVFIIEDLDRYPSDICIPILTKLRQINSMLNSRYRNQHRGYGMHYKFVYLLNDRIFDASESSKTISEKDPYKFFDVIIPVLPRLGFTNSTAIIKQSFAQTFTYDYFDSDLLSVIGQNLYDFRKLHDIENEYRVYREQFDENVSSSSLLAFVTYKVFFKEKYDQFYKKDEKTGEPQNSFLRNFLNHTLSDHKSEEFENALESFFLKDLFVILRTDSATVKKWLKSLNACDEKDKDLTAFNLSGFDLSFLTLDHFKLEHAKLLHTSLEHTELRNTNLRNADLCGANLRNAKIIDSNIIQTNLSETNLIAAQFINTAFLLPHDDESISFLESQRNYLIKNGPLGSYAGDNWQQEVASYQDEISKTHELDCKSDITQKNHLPIFWSDAKYCLDPDNKTVFPDKFPEQTLRDMIEVDKDGKPVKHTETQNDKSEAAALPAPAEEVPVSESYDSTNKKSASAPPPKKQKKKKHK